MSLWAEYVSEREREVIEDENRFVTFYTVKDRTFIEDLFVTKAKRGTGLGLDLMRQVEVLAKERGSTQLVATVIPKFKAATETVRLGIKFGMKIVGIDSESIWLVKELSNG